MYTGMCWTVLAFPGRLNLQHFCCERNKVQPFFTSDLGDALGGTYANAAVLANEDPTMLVSTLNKTVGYLGALAALNGDDSVSSAYETAKLILTSVQLRDPISISGKQSLVVLKTHSR